jgi:hypothetical protein
MRYILCKHDTGLRLYRIVLECCFVVNRSWVYLQRQLCELYWYVNGVSARNILFSLEFQCSIALNSWFHSHNKQQQQLI